MLVWLSDCLVVINRIQPRAHHSYCSCVISDNPRSDCWFVIMNVLLLMLTFMAKSLCGLSSLLSFCIDGKNLRWM